MYSFCAFIISRTVLSAAKKWGPPVGMLIGLLRKDGSVTRINPLTIKVRKCFHHQRKRFPFRFKVVRDTWSTADRIQWFGMRSETKPAKDSHRNGKSNMIKLFKRQTLWGKWLIHIGRSGLGSLLELRFLYYAEISDWFRFRLWSSDWNVCSRDRDLSLKWVQ